MLKKIKEILFEFNLINAIVGFEIEVTELNNVFKLSQNHDEENRLSIISHLLNREDEQSNAIAQEMKKTDGNQ